MSKLLTARYPDYQIFDIDLDGRVCGPGERMRRKLEAIPFPDLTGKKVLDVGCDFGFWTFLASNKGASRVLGLDRGRPVRGEYFDVIASNRGIAEENARLNNCYFEHVDIGKNWKEWGRFDVIFLFSLYHHIFENCGDHRMIWFWLWRQLSPGGELLWENPVDLTDGVAHGNISKDKHALYTRENIVGAASEYFNVEYVGLALHEPTRHVYRFTRKRDRDLNAYRHLGVMEKGAGGAAKAFEHADSRRARQIFDVLGFMPFPGSLNLTLDTPFDFCRDYYSGTISDVKDRAAGLDSAWVPRQCRFYPVTVNGLPCHAMRFHGDESCYPAKFIEIIAPARIRDIIEGEKVTLERP